MAYDALIAKWTELGAPSVDDKDIAAAKVALALPRPVAPEPDKIGVVDVKFDEAVAAFEEAARDHYMGYASIFHGDGVTAKLALLNEMTVEGPRASNVPVTKVMAYLRTNNLWRAIRLAQATSDGAAAAVDYNSDLRTSTIDVDLPIVRAMLVDLVNHNLLSQEQSDEIVAMGATTLPWWQSVGLTSPVSGGDLEAVFIQTGNVLI